MLNLIDLVLLLLCHLLGEEMSSEKLGCQVLKISQRIAGYSTGNQAGNYGGLNGSNGEVSPSTNRIKSRLSFSSRIPSPLGVLPQVSEIDSNSIAGSPTDGKTGNGNGDARFYSAGFPYGSWNDSSHFTDNFPAMKRDQENDRKFFSSTQVSIFT